ncbi:hypothetical protein MMC12_007422 [Toensbergia leucococca]|nr:hypothetical protein [Toensbergia leucococca]
MPAPEIELPPTSLSRTYSDEERFGVFREKHESNEGIPGRRRKPSESFSLERSPIVQHYLTFETELPSPSTLTPPYQDALPTPQPPDLRNYVSPFTWSEPRKTYTTWLSCAVTVVTAYTAGAYSLAAPQMSQEWGVSLVAIYVGITTFTTGFAIAPMILAPFSEINGRKPVFIATGILFVICQLCCAVTRSFPGMLVARFWLGVGGSTFSTMVGGVVSDIYHTKDRNTPMALFAGSALFGTGLGPVCSGFLVQNMSWRWVFYIQVITCGFLILLVIVFFQETRGSVLLSKRARILNDWYEAREKAGYFGFDMPVSEDGVKKQSQRIRWKVKSDEERETLAKMIGISVYRPFHLLVTESVVFFFSLWVAFSWAVLYLTFSAIPLVFINNHGFNTQESGAVFAAMCTAALLSTVLSIYQEKIAIRYGKISSTPEGRLYFSCIQSAFLPIGLFWFGTAILSCENIFDVFPD